MWFGFMQPLVGEKRCVTTLITAAEETRSTRIADLNKNSTFSRMRHTTIGAILIQKRS